MYFYRFAKKILIINNNIKLFHTALYSTSQLRIQLHKRTTIYITVKIRYNKLNILNIKLF